MDGVVGERLAKRLDDPPRGRMFGYGDVEHAEGRRWHGEEVHPGEVLAVVAKELAPLLPRFGIGGAPWHHSGDRALGNVEAEHEKFTVDARRTPRRVLRRHTPDQATEFGFRRGASDNSARDR